MHIELFEQHEGVKRGAKNQWYWRTVNKGRKTGGNGKWDDRAHAARQAKAHIVAAIKPYRDFRGGTAVLFTKPEWDKKCKCWIIKWA